MYGFGSLAPTSNVVQSDYEFMQPWQQGLDEAKSTLQNAQSMAASVPTKEQYFGQKALESWNANHPGASDLGGLYTAMALTPGIDNKFYIDALSRGAAGDVNQFWNYDPAAEAQSAQRGIDQAQAGLDRAQGSYDTAFGERADNVKRQTNAFGQMQGGNYFGGMVDEGYSMPSGGAAAGGNVGGLGGLGGMPNTDSANPFASYNATWQPPASQKRAGTWGSPFGGW